MTEPFIIQQSQIKAAAAVLGRAFYNDAPMIYSIPDERQRRKTHLIIEAHLRCSFSHGAVFTTSSNFEAVAVWLSSASSNTGLWHDLRNGWLAILLHLGLGTALRQREIAAVMGKVHKRCITSPHHYLFFLGVEPELQGRGYASKVMRPMLNRADREGFPCYLDNTSEKNLPIYRHFGFEVVEEYPIPGVSSGVWAMVRNPRKQ